MYSRSIVALLLCAVLALSTLASAQRLYVRHKRSLERENVPAKESTVVVQGPTATGHPVTRDLPKDFENEIASSEKDCKDFLEFDYNPVNDSLFFNGRLPSLFHNHRNLNSFEQMFHRMLTQASQMFNRFPMDAMPSASNNYPDNYNGTVEEIVTMGGQQFRKKQHIINKTSGGAKISIMSTVYEPVNAAGGDNTTTLSTDAEAGTVHDDLTDGKIISYK